MTKLITVQRAKKEIERLQHFVALAESYDSTTLENWIIKEYAYTNSIGEIVKRANDKELTNNEKAVDREFVTSVITGKATDELHRLLKAGYRSKVRPNKTCGRRGRCGSARSK